MDFLKDLLEINNVTYLTNNTYKTVKDVNVGEELIMNYEKDYSFGRFAYTSLSTS